MPLSIWMIHVCMSVESKCECQKNNYRSFIGCYIHMYLCLYIQRRTMCLTLFLSFYLFYDWLSSFVAPKWWHTVSMSIVCVSALFLELIKCCEFCEESIMSWNCAIEHGGGAGVAIMIVNFSLFHVSFPPIQWTNVTE